MPKPTVRAGANHRSVKAINRATVYGAIRDVGPVARIEVARRTGLTPATVSNIVDELIAADLARETGFGTSRVGRKPVFLEINASARYAIGLSLSRTGHAGAIVNLAGQVQTAVTEQLASTWNRDIALATICDMTDRLLASLPVEERNLVVGLGIGAIGPVGSRVNHHHTPLFSGSWPDPDLHDHIVERTGLPTYVDNDGNASALAELWFGAGQDVSNFVLILPGSGVGAGLVLDGDLYRGTHDLAAEIGHISIDPNGPRCACGNFGCLELYVSIPRILATIDTALATGEPSVLGDMLAQGNERSAEPIRAAARIGDPLARRVVTDIARQLAIGVVAVVHTLDPDLVLIGRDLVGDDGVILDPLRDEVRRRLIPGLRETIRIEPAALPNAPVIGAATLALREFFQEPLADHRRPRPSRAHGAGRRGAREAD